MYWIHALNAAWRTMIVQRDFICGNWLQNIISVTNSADHGSLLQCECLCVNADLNIMYPGANISPFNWDYNIAHTSLVMNFIIATRHLELVLGFDVLYKLTRITAIIVSARYMFLLSQAFDVVEKSYFETIDDALAEKAHLSNYLLPHNEVHIHTQTQSAKHIDRLSWKLRRGVLCWFP